MTRLSSEETPLLTDQAQCVHSETQRTPLRWSQFSILLLLQVSVSITAQFIMPFLPELVRGTGIPDSSVGYYVGLMTSFSHLTEACTTFYWSRLSDKIGRKHVLLVGLVGQSLFMWRFGLSKTFWGLLVSLSLSGALNGNIGVMRSIMIEMTDSTNIAQAFGIMPLTRALGTTVGSLIGGFLARPADRFPKMFGDSEFLKEYPYFLPCLVPVIVMLLSSLITCVFMKETKEHRMSLKQYLFGKTPGGNELASEAQIGNLLHGDDPATKPKHEQLPLRALLTRPVLIAIGSYSALSLVGIAIHAITPVFYAMPIRMGGLHLDPPAIGTILALFAIPGAIIQWLFFAPMHAYLGAKTSFLCTVSLYLPVVVMCPVMNALARSHGLGYSIVWFLVGFQRFLHIFASLSFETALMYVAAAAPNKESIGATNGLAQTAVSLACVIGPAAVNSAFSFSIEKHIMGGYLAYWVMAIMVVLTLQIGYMLPRNMWKE